MIFPLSANRWDESCEFTVNAPGYSKITIEVWDRDFFTSDDFMVCLPFSNSKKKKKFSPQLTRGLTTKKIFNY